MTGRYGSRKFVVALGALIGVHLTLWGELIAAADYRAIVLGVVGLYAAGNVAHRAVERTQPANTGAPGRAEGAQ